MQYILRRLGFYLTALWAGLTINFFLPRLLPGDPAQVIFGGTLPLDADQLASVRAALGITDAPLIQQYFGYLGNVLQGNLGYSFMFYPATVGQVIGQGIGWTLLLGLTTLILAYILGNALGIFVSWRRGGLADTIFPPLLILIGSFPPFFVALAAVFFLGYQLGWFPTSRAFDPNLIISLAPTFFASVLQHLALPAMVSILGAVGGWALGMRNMMVTVLAEDYITLAEAKGLKQGRIMFHYAARNALLPSVTSFGLSLGFVISGQVLIENIFAYPGVGYLLTQSVAKLDYPLMQGLFMLITLVVLVANFTVDLLYSRLDPRVRAS
jgi:peptide/nickel transport system permease protein